MAFTKIAAAGIGSTGTVTLEHVVVTGSVETPVITGAASTANVRANSLVVSGVSTFGSVVATTGTFSGNVSIAGTLTYEDVTNIDSVGLITARSGIRVNSGGLVVTSGVSTLGTTSATNLSSQTLNVTGISTFSNNPVLIGSGTSTGTTSQPLQVTGGAYVSGNLGVGVTNPGAKLHLIGNQYLQGGNYFTDTTSGYFWAGNGSYAGGIYGSNSGNVTTIISPQTINLVTSSTQRASINSSGQFFVGTTNQYPSSTSNTIGIFNGTILCGNTNGFTTSNTGSSTDTAILCGGDIEFGRDGVSGTQRRAKIRGIADNLGGPYSGGMAFDYYYYNGSAYVYNEGLRISSSGTVGIRTTLNGTLGGFAAPNLYVKQTATDWTGGVHIESASDQSVGTISMNNSGFEFGQSYRSTGVYRNINFYTSGIKTVTIDTAGRLTLPYQPAFRVYSPSGAANTIITFGSTEFNIGNHMNASTGVFTAPIAGRYLFTFSILSGNPMGSYVRMAFCKNSNTADFSYGDSLWDGLAAYGSPSMSMIFSLAANDTIRLKTEGSGVYATNYGSFSGCLIG